MNNITLRLALLSLSLLLIFSCEKNDDVRQEPVGGVVSIRDTVYNFEPYVGIVNSGTSAYYEGHFTSVVFFESSYSIKPPYYAVKGQGRSILLNTFTSSGDSLDPGVYTFKNNPADSSTIRSISWLEIDMGEGYANPLIAREGTLEVIAKGDDHYEITFDLLADVYDQRHSTFSDRTAITGTVMVTSIAYRGIPL